MFLTGTNDDPSHLDGLRMVFDSVQKIFVPFQAGVHLLADIVGVQVSELASYVLGPTMDLDTMKYSYYRRNHLGECTRDILDRPIVNPDPPPTYTHQQRVATVGEIARIYAVTLDTANDIAPAGVDPLTLVFLTPQVGVNIPSTWKILETGTYVTIENQTYMFWSVLIL